ncbi:MAG: MarR family transcriptional regulator, partial [Deltaproteobacteria bacterium]|nr:MarR family transcriptional regulator [Deltaproteobacteria bacterium]
KKYNVSAHQLNCLVALYENGPIPPSRIAKIIIVSSSTAPGIIDRLELKGLVTRIRKSPDRRVITIELTEVGRSLAHNAPPPIQNKIVCGLKRLPEGEIKEIVRSLKKLTNMLDVQDLQV